MRRCIVWSVLIAGVVGWGADALPVPAQSVGRAGASAPFNRGMVSYGRSRVGQRIGNGSDAAFVLEALRNVGAHPTPAGEYGRRLAADEPSQPGDIVLFQNCEFAPGPRWGGRHVAILRAVQGTRWSLVHQTTAEKTVEQTEVDLAALTQGMVIRFRPQGA